VLAFLFSKKWQIPYFITDHWTGYIHGAFQRKSLLYKWITRFMVQKAKGVSVVSSSLLQSFNYNHLRNRDLRIIPNVVDFPERFPVREHSGVIRILTVADLADANKNVSGVIRVLSTHTDKLPEFQYHIVGGGEDEQVLKKLAASFSSLNGKVIFHGRVSNEQVYNYFRESDFLVVNSRVETFSVVTAEAIACGLPVIATRSGGPEFFVNSINGLLIPKEDDDALSAAICEMAGNFLSYDPVLMRQSIEEKFSTSAVAAQFKQLYLDHLKF
jgi:glycosyltransferase involved in cell wall biosynthesis